MAKREIIILPDRMLKQVSSPIKTIDTGVRDLADDMLETMYAAPGIGLAAVQVGILERMLVMDVAREDEEPDPICMINPEIVWSSEELSEHEEGCLSIPETYDAVVRPAEVKVQYLDREGAECERDCSGLLATCVQHEIDHLNGVLFIDHLSRLKRDRIVKKFVKAAKAKEATA